MSRARLLWRKSLNALMLTLTGVAAFSVVSVLFFILGYLVYNGGKSLNWAFFTQIPKPVGETGGGMANAIVGSLKLLLLAAAMGLPIGLLAGIYLAEFGGRAFSFLVRYTTDLLNGVPSIVMGIFAYSLVVVPMRHFSTLAGGVALGIMVIPITVRSTEEFLRSVPGTLREGAMALGASKWKTIATVVLPAARAGISHRHVAGSRPRGWRNCASHFHRFWQSILESRLEPAYCLSARDDLYLRDCSIRGLASPGMGGRTGSLGYGADCKHWYPPGR